MHHKDSVASHDRSSLFEEMSNGPSVDHVNDIPKKRRRSQSRLRLATNQNANVQENLINLMNDSDFVPELMYQHVQFRRMEKFNKNYTDAGTLMHEKKKQNNNKILQEVRYMD